MVNVVAWPFLYVLLIVFKGQFAVTFCTLLLDLITLCDICETD